MEGFNIPLPKTSLSDLQQQQALVDANANANTGANRQCGQIQAPMYEVPISDAAKKANTAALNAFANGQGVNQPISTLPTARKPVGGRPVDMTKVAGLYDDDIDQYMNLQTPSTTNQSQQPTNMNLLPQVPQSGTIANPPSPAAFPNANATPLTKAMASFQSNDGSTPLLWPVDPTFSNSNTKNKETSKWQYVMDLILFIAAGVLVIMLCEMLFKIALTIGMRDTINVIEPYLAELQELKLKIAELGRESHMPLAAP